MFRNLFIKSKYLSLITKRNFSPKAREVNLRKPKEPDFEKKLLLSITEPYYKKNLRLDSERCREEYNIKEDPHPYTKMLVEDCKKEINSPYVFIYHLGPLSKYHFNNLRKEFQKNNIFLRNYSPEIIELSLKNTKYSCLIDIIVHHGVFSFSDYNCFEFLKNFLKNRNRIHLLGGIIEERILTLDELEKYSQYKTIENIRLEFYNTMNEPVTSLQSTINSQFQNLVNNLNYLKQKF